MCLCVFRVEWRSRTVTDDSSLCLDVLEELPHGDMGEMKKKKGLWVTCACSPPFPPTHHNVPCFHLYITGASPLPTGSAGSTWITNSPSQPQPPTCVCVCVWVCVWVFSFITAAEAFLFFSGSVWAHNILKSWNQICSESGVELCNEPGVNRQKSSCVHIPPSGQVQDK